MIIFLEIIEKHSLIHILTCIIHTKYDFQLSTKKYSNVVVLVGILRCCIFAYKVLSLIKNTKLIYYFLNKNIKFMLKQNLCHHIQEIKNRI